jgi:hypothetical protein
MQLLLTTKRYFTFALRMHVRLSATIATYLDGCGGPWWDVSRRALNFIDDTASTYYTCTLLAVTQKLNVSRHLLIRTFFFFVCGTRAQNLSAPFSYTCNNMLFPWKWGEALQFLKLWRVFSNGFILLCSNFITKHVLIFFFYIYDKRIYCKFKLKLSLCVYKRNSVKADEGIVSLGTRWWWMFSFKSQSLYSWGNCICFRWARWVSQSIWTLWRREPSFRILSNDSSVVQPVS